MPKYDDLNSFDEKPKRKRDEDPTTWGDAWRALGIFASVMIVISVIGFTIQNLVLGDRLREYYEFTGLTTPGSGMASFFTALEDISSSPLFSGIVMVVSAILTVLVLLIVYGIFHLIASKFFGGEGTLRGLIVRANPATIGSYAVFTIISVISSNLLIYTITERFADTSPFATAATMQEYQNIVSSYSFVNLSTLIIWVVWSVLMARVIGKNYQTSTKQGCLSVFVSNIVFGVVYCGIIFAITGFFISTMDFSQPMP